MTKAAKVQKLGVNNDDYLDMNPPNQVNPNPSFNPTPYFLNLKVFNHTPYFLNNLSLHPTSLM